MFYFNILSRFLLSFFLMVFSFSSLALADKAIWKLDGETSKISYVSIKKNTVGEVNSFGKVSGEVLENGNVTINIDVTSVQTNIDIRNERMIAHVFDVAQPTATLKAKIDTTALSKLEVGDTVVKDVEGVLTLSGVDVAVEASLFIARLSDEKVLVTTDEMIVVGTKDLGIDEGIDKLVKLAKLPGITRVVPVSLRLMFASLQGDLQQDNATKGAALEQQVDEIKVASTSDSLNAGDAVAGKKVFRLCRACHVAEEAKNKVGPYLKGVVGRKAASIDGFNYSKAFKAVDIRWNEENLAQFLAKPRAFIKGNRMSFPGLKKEEDVQNVIAYLKSVAN